MLTRSADEQDFFLNKFAAIQLGNIGDPKAIPGLIKGLFMTGRGADIFQECRISLAQMGEAAVDPLIELLQEKNAAVNEMRKKLDFDKHTPGVIPAKAAYVLGDLRPKKALPVLLARLKEKSKDAKNNMRISILVTLGQYGDPSAIPDDPRGPQGRAARATSSAARPPRRSTSSATARCCRTSTPASSNAKTPPNVRVACGFAYASLGTDAEVAKFETLAKSEGYEEFKMALERLKLAKDVQAGRRLLRQGLRRLGRPRTRCCTRCSRPATSSAASTAPRRSRSSSTTLGKTDQLEVEQALLFALSRQAGKDCKECKEKIKALLDKQEKTPTKIAKVFANELKVSFALLSR